MVDKVHLAGSVHNRRLHSYLWMQQCNLGDYESTRVRIPLPDTDSRSGWKRRSGGNWNLHRSSRLHLPETAHRLLHTQSTHPANSNRGEQRVLETTYNNTQHGPHNLRKAS